ncbi:MAG: hypothetical protein ACQET7_05935, partial [Thermodesulfobacteriota bacterium]
ILLIPGAIQLLQMNEQDVTANSFTPLHAQAITSPHRVQDYSCTPICKISLSPLIKGGNCFPLPYQANEGPKRKTQK